MQLHDIDAAVDRQRRIRLDGFQFPLERYQEAIARQYVYPRMRGAPLAVADWAILDEAVEAVEFRAFGAREEAMEVGRILARLDRQYMRLCQIGVAARDVMEMAFILTEHEWALLRYRLTWHELTRQGFPYEEGVDLSYRGYPLRIVRDF